jgi:hypothetical protein
VLKNRETNKELFVIVISLIPTEEAKKQDGVPDPEERFEEVHYDDTQGRDDDELD